MDKTNLLLSHLRDLALQCDKTQLPKCSSFLSSSEAEAIFKGNVRGHIEDVAYILYGGNDEAERLVVIFLPPYLEDSDPKQIAEEEGFIHLVEFLPKSISFATPYGHRDLLGALMNKGIKRETIGDIYIQESKGYAYLSKAATKEALEIDRIKACQVVAKEIKLDDCPISIRKETFLIQVSSFRLDLIVAESFHCSREFAQRLIEGDKVHLGFQDIVKNDSKVKEREKIYVEGKGKIQFIGQTGLSKKGKLILELQRYL